MTECKEVRLNNYFLYSQMILDGNQFIDFFEEGDTVLIYGHGDMGKLLYENIKNNIEVLGFIDKIGNGEEYRGTKVYYMQTPELRELVEKNRNVKVIITPIWDIAKIEADIFQWLGKVTIIPVNYIFWYLKYKNETIEFAGKNSLDNIVFNLTHNDINIDVFFGANAYMTMLYMIMKEDWMDTFFIFEDDFMEGIFSNLVRNKVDSLMYVDNNSNIELAINILNSLALRGKCHFWGSDNIFASRRFVKEGFTVIEDGNNNYDPEKCISGRVDGYVQFGFDSQIKKVILSGKHKVPDLIRDKSEVLDFYDLWQKKDEKEKKLIMQLLQFPKEQIEYYIEEGKDIIFLAQKFSRHGFISEENQVKMCKEVLEKYDKKKVLIKPHPADIVNYSKYFPEYTILDGKFPIDFIKYENMKIKKLVGFFSTSLYGLLDEESVDLYPEIAEKYGIRAFPDKNIF